MRCSGRWWPGPAYPQHPEAPQVRRKRSSGELEMWGENRRWGVLVDMMDQSSVVCINPTLLASLWSSLKPHTLHLLITTWDQKEVRDYSLFYKGCASETSGQLPTPPSSSGLPCYLILGPKFPPEQDQSDMSYRAGWSIQGDHWWALTRSLEHSQRSFPDVYIALGHWVEVYPKLENHLALKEKKTWKEKTVLRKIEKFLCFQGGDLFSN